MDPTSTITTSKHMPRAGHTEEAAAEGGIDGMVAVGSAVDNAARRCGTIVEAMDNDAREKPYKVRFG